MEIRIRFYFDQHIPVVVARGLQRRGVDVLTAQEAGQCGFSDPDQLSFALRTGRVLVTFDADFLALTSGDAKHAGIAFCSATKYSIGELIYGLLLLHEALTPQDFLDHVEFF